MDEAYSAVLPDALVSRMMEKIGDISVAINRTFDIMVGKRDVIRNQMLAATPPQIVPFNKETVAGTSGIVIDGACLVEHDRGSSHGISCVVRFGSDTRHAEYVPSIFSLPHITSIGSLSVGFMLMQEMMLAVETAMAFPQNLVFIDGSRTSLFIKISQFYNTVKDERPELLGEWRAPGNTSELAAILQKFEAKNWFEQFISLPNVLGLVKLVTTTTLVKEFFPEIDDHIDDKMFAALVLEKGERTAAIPMKNTMAGNQQPFHMSGEFPYADQFYQQSRSLTEQDSPNRIFHVYLRTAGNDCINKIEFNGGLGELRLDQALSWVDDESPVIDIKEPFPMYMADRFAKEAVTVCKEALFEVSKINSGTNLSWYFSGMYRSE